MRAHADSLAGGPSIRRTSATTRTPLRVLVANEDALLREALGTLLAGHCAPALPFGAADVPSALEALLIRHPDLVVTDLRMPGHPQGGFRIVLDAVSVGVPIVVVTDSISRSLERRLTELGVGWVRKGSNAAAVFSAVDRALAARPGSPAGLGNSTPPRPLFETA